ncbi:hypothetical protein CC80DRAFT_420934, partial [Byssothecium circinans]
VKSQKVHVWSQNLPEKHNHTMELRMFGEKLVMIDDPENIQAIQETHFSELAKAEEQRIIFQHVFGDASFWMNGEEWKAEAALYRVHLSHVRDSVLTVTERHIINSFALLDREGNDVADIVDPLQLDVVTEVFLGESTNSLTSNQEQFRTAMEIKYCGRLMSATASGTSRRLARWPFDIFKTTRISWRTKPS